MCIAVWLVRYCEITQSSQPAGLLRYRGIGRACVVSRYYTRLQLVCGPAAAGLAICGPAAVDLHGSCSVAILYEERNSN